MTVEENKHFVRGCRSTTIAMYRLAGGKLVEEWECSGQLALMQQLAVVEG